MLTLDTYSHYYRTMSVKDNTIDAFVINTSYITYICLVVIMIYTDNFLCQSLHRSTKGDAIIGRQ